MTWQHIVAFGIPAWLACSALLALAMGRTVRIRDRSRVARTVPLDTPTTDEWRRVVAATEEEDS